VSPAPSNYSLFFNVLRFEDINIVSILNTKEGAGVSPAPFNYSSLFKALGFKGINLGGILNKKEGAG